MTSEHCTRDNCNVRRFDAYLCRVLCSALFCEFFYRPFYCEAALVRSYAPLVIFKRQIPRNLEIFMLRSISKYPLLRSLL